MAMKGSATIELTNADGSKEIIKHDNMITNAVSDLCLAQRGEMAAILKMVNQGDNYAQTMFGGLLLFDAELNSDPADYTIPTSKITGYASQTSYTGLDLARGSFNGAEGGVQEDGSYKFVWDFGTSQGNGTIKSLALCPNAMGKIGASDTIVSGESGAGSIVRGPVAPFNTEGRMLDSSGTTDGINNWNYSICAIIGDIAYALDFYNINYNNNYTSRYIMTNGGILKLHRFKLGATSVSLADKAGMARYIDAVDIQLPTELISSIQSNNDYAIGTYFDHKSNKLIVFPCFIAANVPVNGTLPYIDINLADNMKVTKYTFTNTTAGTILKNNNGYHSNCGDGIASYTFFVIEDYILVLSKANDKVSMYLVNREDNTKVLRVTFAGDDIPIDSYYYGNRYFYGIAPYFVNKNTFVFKISSSYDDGKGDLFILDLATGVCKKMNSASLYPPYLNFGNDIVQIRTGPYLKYYIDVNPFILTTKNNLDSPVIKTASQTMKITYTLSEVNKSEV